MLEIIALVFITRSVGKMAERKGLKPGTWKIYAVLSWFTAEVIGFILGMNLFGQNLIYVILFALFCAFGGFLFIHSILKNKPDIPQKGLDDLL